MDVLDAIEVVLAEAGRPLHCQVIAQQLLDHKLWSTKGKDPGAIVNVYLSKDIRERPSHLLLYRSERGIYGLRLWESPATAAVENVATPGHSAGDTEGGNGGVPVPRRLSLTDAAEQVLERFAARHPMHYREIARKALELGLIDEQSQTPEATLSTLIGVDIRKSTQRGEAPRFTRPQRGFVGLSSWQVDDLSRRIEQHNAHVRQELLERLKSLAPASFERLIGRLLSEIGFEVSVTSQTRDGGIDVHGTLVVGDVIRVRMAVQAKRWSSNVQAPIVQQVRGSLGAHDQGLIITTSDFSRGAREEAERPNAVPVALMNGEQLVKLLVEHELGVKKAPHSPLELPEEWSDEVWDLSEV